MLELGKYFTVIAVDLPDFGDSDKPISSKLRIPVLALGGATSMRDLTERDMRQIAINVESHIIPQFGHAIEENPQGVLDAILPFLRKGKWGN